MTTLTYNIPTSSFKISNQAYTENAQQTEPDNGGYEMKRETDRLRTFQEWPCPFISANSLAKAGFYYLGREDKVKCAFCPIEIEKWEEDDDPMECHRTFSPECPFVQKASCGNVPVDQTPNGSASEDTCGKYGIEGIEVRPLSLPEDEASPSYSRNRPNFAKLGIFTNRGPSYPCYANYESRLKSFTEWPKSMKQKPNELASAGFYYTGKGDQTVCFHCGGGLKDWEDNDDPWEQHALWFKKCNYLLLQKGQDFISEVCSGNSGTANPPEASSVSSKTAAKSPESTSTSSTKPTNTNTKELPEENCKTASNTLCKICYSKEVGVVFLPCGHLVACVDCAPALNRCAVCRKPLEATVRAYVS